MALSRAVPLQVLHGASAHATLTLPSNSRTVHFGCKCAVCYIQRLQKRTGGWHQRCLDETRFSTSLHHRLKQFKSVCTRKKQPTVSIAVVVLLYDATGGSGTNKLLLSFCSVGPKQHGLDELNAKQL